MTEIHIMRRAYSVQAGQYRLVLDTDGTWRIYIGAREVSRHMVGHVLAEMVAQNIGKNAESIGSPQDAGS